MNTTTLSNEQQIISGVIYIVINAVLAIVIMVLKWVENNKITKIFKSIELKHG